MRRPLTLADKKFIEKQAELGCSSEQIALALGVSIWTVRKWRPLVKKGSMSVAGAALLGEL